ncbi:MAG TPA: STAS domain-containing protein [Labilithrix sp.]|nr:STAS domain-containing protein [Labilithrix sp.]
MSNENVVIHRGRIERLIEVLALISIGDLDPERTTIDIQNEDEFASLEVSLNVFIAELTEARRQSEEAMQNLVASRSELEDKLATIERQQMTIKDLSTPVLELWQDIITLPVVGIVDSQRSVEMTETLLTNIVNRRAKCVILDLTGVQLVDTMTAHHFIKLAESARLLGAHCVITGISPAIAHTLSLEGGIGDLKTLRSLREGIKECLRFLRAGRERWDTSGEKSTSLRALR